MQQVNKPHTQRNEMGNLLSCYKRRKSFRKKESTMTNFDLTALPNQLREKIWRCLDNNSKKMVRQVCSLFKKEIDLGSGLSVLVDDSSIDNLKFVHSIEAQKVSLLGLKSKPSLKIFRCPLNVIHLTIHCPLTPPIFHNIILPMSPHLVSLSLMTMSLTMKPFTNSHFSLHDLKKDNVPKMTYNFPSLLSLEIEYGHWKDSSQNFQTFNSNIKTIMLTFKCPKLTHLIIHPSSSVLEAMSQNSNLFPSDEIDWENGPLKLFVHGHRTNLKLIDIFLYSREMEGDSLEDGHVVQLISPIKLTDLIIVIPFITIARQFNSKCYWKDICLNCSQLERLILQIEFWCNYTEFFKILPQILHANQNTLTILRLESFALQDETITDYQEYRRNSLGQTLSFNLFSHCHHLKSLELCQLNPTKYFVATDLIHLPPSLERFEIKRIFIPTEELLLIGLPNLKKINLFQVGSTGVFGVDFQVLRKIFEMKNLQEFQLTAPNFDRDAKKMVAFLKKSQPQLKSAKDDHLDVRDATKTIIIRRDYLKLKKMI